MFGFGGVHRSHGRFKMGGGRQDTIGLTQGVHAKEREGAERAVEEVEINELRKLHHTHKNTSNPREHSTGRGIETQLHDTHIYIPSLTWMALLEGGRTRKGGHGGRTDKGAWRGGSEANMASWRREELERVDEEWGECAKSSHLLT